MSYEDGHLCFSEGRCLTVDDAQGGRRRLQSGATCAPLTLSNSSSATSFSTLRLAESDVWRAADGRWLQVVGTEVYVCDELDESAKVNQVPKGMVANFDADKPDAAVSLLPHGLLSFAVVTACCLAAQCV